MRVAQHASKETAAHAQARPQSLSTTYRRPGRGDPASALLHLQRTYGNRFVGRSLNQTAIQRKCACGGSSSLLADCEECRRKATALQRFSSAPNRPFPVPAIVHQVLRSSGQPLDHATRSFMESRFGHDFSEVRVHTDARAAESARAVNALAYTVGRDVVFAAGQYTPTAAAGQNLLTHELVHVLQQRGATAAVQPQLQLGTVQDAAEREADHLTDQISSDAAPGPQGPVSVRQTPPTVRRQPTTPQRVGEERMATLPQPALGPDQARMHVIRSFVLCPCRRVMDPREGIFYDPNLNTLAIAYRHCRGGTTVDVYGQLQSNAQAFLGNQAPPQATARIGIDINVVGRSIGGRVVLEALGTNQPVGEGIGGHAQIVFQGDTWRIFLEPQFIRRLRQLPGAETQNELQISLGGQFRNVTLRVDLNDLLDPTLRRGTGTLCIPAGSGFDICPFLQVGGGRGVTVGVGVNIPLGGPQVRPETCRQCFCPPPTRKYECIEDVLPREEEVQEKVPEERQREFRYYFKLDRTLPSEDPALRAQSDANLAALVAQVRAGGRLTLIFGYASPEAEERHNQPLSEDRARKMRELIEARVGTGVELPEPLGGGELLGRRPSPNPSSRLGEVITASGFRSAEDLTVLLTGDEIPNPELTRQFRSLFEALPEPADRLAVFGLTPDDPIARQVRTAIEQFLESPRGRRPWERIFRPLRVAVARVTRIEMVEETRTVRHPGSVNRLSDEQCQPYAREAERAGRFGPVDESARRPTTDTEESNTDCLIEPSDAERRQGCDYELPSRFRGRITPPSIAPQQLR